MFDSTSTNPGFQSVYGPARLCPDPDLESGDWLRFMLDLAKAEGERPVLIASSDKFVSAIARHEKALSEHFTISPGAALQGALADKRPQYELAARHGMPMPVTRFAQSLDDVRKFVSVAAFPCVMKPNHFREWQKFAVGHPLRHEKVAVVTNGQQLVDAYSLAADVTPDVILQEVIQGPDTAKRVYLSCYAADGRRIANAMFRELRCDPFEFGPASVSEPIDDPEVDEICDSFLRKVGYSGICEIEMKRDTRDGRAKLIEVNPRLSGGGDAAPYAGVDLCWIHYRDLVGQPLPPAAPRGNHFRHVVLRADSRAIPAYLKAGMLTWKDVFRTCRGPLAFFDFDRRDWRYSLETVYVCVRQLLAGLFSKRDRSR
jgi:predicted ATP-grasp superfamily ATP-dependent carboligase